MLCFANLKKITLVYLRTTPNFKRNHLCLVFTPNSYLIQIGGAQPLFWVKVLPKGSSSAPQKIKVVSIDSFRPHFVLFVLETFVAFC